jgi:hypothetical protein
MLDIDKALVMLPGVTEVHILEWRGECREVLYIMTPGTTLMKEDVPITAVQIDDDGRALKAITFTRRQEKSCRSPLALPGAFLYEPGPAFQKAGGFNIMGKTFQVCKLHPHTHLYTSEQCRVDFPGRHFKILGLLPLESGALPFKQANLSIRNFPATVETLKKKLKLRDGGQDYLFACTLMDERKILLHVHKI